MRAKQIKVFEKFIVVEGAGVFPLDMLRYDSAFPSSEHDSAIAANYSGRRAVALVLRSLSNNGPAEERWASFMWKVVDITSDRIDAEDFRTVRQKQLEIERAKREAEKK